MTRTVMALDPRGLQDFGTYLDQLSRGAAAAQPPIHLLDVHGDASGLAAVSIDPEKTFPNKLEFGRYLVRQLKPLLDVPGIDRHVGLWSWLALCWFDLLCPASEDGTRKPGADHRYVLSRDYKHHYRHLVRTPCLVYALHGEHARMLLAGDVSAHGEASEQILSREHLFTNKPLFEAMDSVYVRGNPDGTFQVKKGARGSAAGSLRRLGKVVRQFDLTFDLRAMTGPQICELLPREFDRFKEPATARERVRA